MYKPSPSIWRRFTELDWVGFAGATSFGENNPPLIADIRIDGQEAIAICDADGLSIFWGKDMGKCISLQTNTPLPIANLLNGPEYSSGLLQAVGWKRERWN